jgi:nicotinate-nucleotide adenylyltransferase
LSSRPVPVRWSEVTALFGGTFDPPHLGHRIAVAGLFSNPGVGRVRILPTPSPPHKPTIASTEDRLAMTRLAFGESRIHPLPGPVEIELCELERSRLHPGQPTYSFDSLTELRQRIPHLAFVIGTDQLHKLHTWHRFPEVLGLCHWIILERRNVSEASGPVLTQWEASGLIRREGNGWRTTERLGGAAGSLPQGGFLLPVPTPAPALSSTAIRESLARSGNPPDEALLPEVLTHLMRRRIYGTTLSKKRSDSSKV